ncbi:MAG: sigma 54-interacting transcriptional regulator [Pyrinomonadaceae bacterium]
MSPSTTKLRESAAARPAIGMRPGRVDGARAAVPLPPDRLGEVFSEAGRLLREGRSSRAEEILRDALERWSHDADDFADLKRLLSFALETVGRYKEALDELKAFEDEEVLSKLKIETQVRVLTQLGISYNNINDHPKAVTLLKQTLKKAEDIELRHLSGAVDSALARVYRKLNECPICRDYAERSLNYFRESGNWLGMAEAYREIALSYHQEGNSEKSIEYFDLGVQIIGDRSAPFMLGKLYSDMSGAYWFLRKPEDGIACLERSISFFEKTEHKLNSLIAYNNLGINLMHIGEWPRAEQMIRRALDLAIETKHVHRAGILDSLGELNILRGKYAEAERYLNEAVAIAREGKREWYVAQAMRNLARCCLAQGDLARASRTARETIELCRQIGDKHYINMAGLVLAEAALGLGDVDECDNRLKIIEDNDPTSDFFVLGNIQRIRGLAALNAGDPGLAIHHFNRSLTIFEAAHDVYHTALAHLLVGSTLVDKPRRALKHLAAAREIFERLGTQQYIDRINDAERRARASASEQEGVAAGGPGAASRAASSASQLLTVRLAEATASRELLFREFVAVLQQESQAKRIIVAQTNEAKRLAPFITHGYSPDESSALVGAFVDAQFRSEEKQFAKKKNLAIVTLKSPASAPAYLFINPANGAVLGDGGSLQPLVRVVELGMDVIALREREKSQPTEQEANPYSSAMLMPGFIHSSPAMNSLVEEINKIRSSDVTVLVTGESGTGKELVSRAIHAISNRKDRIFVPFNCTAVPKELAEGHLFGYRKGAFTGAVTDSPGIIRAADGGTLFLDEVGDLPLDVQPKLLRFLQEGEVQPIGERRPIKVDVRVIAATNMPLEDRVAEGTFREDLYYRLNVIRLRVPPLRERRSEIPPLVNYYIDHYAKKFGKHDITITPQTVDLLMVCNWEGNVRQLTNEIQRIVARAVDGEVIMPNHLSPELRQGARPLAAPAAGSGVREGASRPITSYDLGGPLMPFANIASTGGTLEQAVTELEIQMIKAALARHNWNISRVARELGLTRRGLYLKLSRYAIEKDSL